MPKKQPFVMPPTVVVEMEQVVAEGVVTYLTEFTRGLFPDFKAAQAQECVLNGIAAAIRRYEQEVGRPICHTLALNLLDVQKENQQ